MSPDVTAVSSIMPTPMVFTLFTPSTAGSIMTISTQDTPTIDPALIAGVRERAAETHHGPEHVDRWNRVLAAFGLYNHDNPMTAAEATTNANTYSSPLWPQVADALTILESAQDPPTPTVSLTGTTAGNEGDDITFTLSASPAPASPLTVSITITHTGGILATSDVGARTITIPTTGALTLTVSTIDDTMPDTNSVTITIQSGNGYVVGTPSTGTTSIPDNDQDPPQDPPYEVPESLVQAVREQASQTQHGDDHVDRWERALAGLGYGSHTNPMTAAEATSNADIYSSPLWPQVADALQKLQGQ